MDHRDHHRRWPLAAALLVGAACLAAAAEGRIAQVEVLGLRYTQAAMVKRELPFAPGDAWQPEWQEETRRRLMATGLFSEVRVEPPDAAGVVRVYARDRWPLWLVPTATRKDNGESYLGLVLEDYNAWGRGDALRLELRRYAGRNFSRLTREQSLSASYRMRRIGGGDWSAKLQGWKDPAGRGWSLAAERTLGPTPELGARFALGWRTQWNANGFRLLGPQLEWRDEVIDEHLDWHRGWRAWASTWWTNYGLYLSGGYARYQLLNAVGDTVAWRLEGGAIQGDRAALGSWDIGHRNGLRGYFPGEMPATSYALASLEGRFLWRGHENVQGVPFVDAALVGWQGKVRVHWGVGAGVRWTLRWLVRGTIRFDIAYGVSIRKWRAYLGTMQAF
ncbi:MAG: hypothetical protein D6771_07700 [Zetaproteobacteria bacterium]|nr:MAG: hypothetical protein D6771_07700 [Zetaproteobacteria bacterium]